MLAGFQCTCLVCEIEASLLRELCEPSNLQSYGRLRAQLGIASAFPTASDLVNYLHRSPETNHQAASDVVILDLFHSRPGDDLERLWRDILILVFVPTIHRTMSQIALSFPALTRNDVAQQLIAAFLETLTGKDLRSRRSYFAFAVARSLRRAAFRWAIRESRFAPPDSIDDEPIIERHGKVSDTAVQSRVSLHQFLDDCQRRGWLTSSERRLIFEAKIEGVSCAELARRNGHTVVAVQHRVHRLIDRLHRLTMKSAPDANPAQMHLFRD